MITRIDLDEAIESSRIVVDEGIENDAAETIDYDDDDEEAVIVRSSRQTPPPAMSMPHHQIFNGLFDHSSFSTVVPGSIPAAQSSSLRQPRKSSTELRTANAALNRPTSSDHAPVTTSFSVAGGDIRSKTSDSGAIDSGHDDDVELGPGGGEPRKKTAIPFLLPALGDQAVGHHGAKHVSGRADDPRPRRRLNFKDQVREDQNAKRPHPRPAAAPAAAAVPKERLLPNFKDQMHGDRRKVVGHRPTRPGGSGGLSPEQEDHLSSAAGDNDEDQNLPYYHRHRRDDANNEYQTVLVSAQLVVDNNDAQQPQRSSQSPILLAVPVAATSSNIFIMSKRRLVLMMVIVLLAAAGIAAVVRAVVLSPSSEQQPAGPTTPSPKTDSSDEWSRQWIETGNIDGGSGDELGISVAISRHGLAFAAASPGAFDGGAVFVYQLGPVGWEFVTKVGGAEWGRSVALDDSGTVLAIGQPIFQPDPLDDDNQFNGATNITGLFGTVEVYRIAYDRSAAWTDSSEQVGPAIVNAVAGDLEFGSSVDLSSDGSVLIIGSSVNCSFHTVRYDSATNDWLPFGQGMTCADQAATEGFGEVTLAHVALSDNGLVAAIGKPSTPADSPGDGVQGSVAIYKYQGSWEAGSWQPLGQTLVGAAYDDAFGASLSLSGDGTVIAVGAPRNNGGLGRIGGVDREVEPNVGACFVYRYSESSQEWRPLGSAILGENVGDLFGTSVSLNGNGAAIAVGAPNNNDNGDDSGHVRVLEFNVEEAEWVRVGQDIPGIFEYALSGSAVALSEGGDTVVVGSPNNVALVSDQQGSVQVLETGILAKNGTVAVTVEILFSYGPDIAWTLERLDVEQAGRVFYASVAEDTYDSEIDDGIEKETTTLMLDDGGVYRFLIVDPEDGYQVFLGNDTNDLGNLLVDERGNFTGYSEFSFLLRTPPANPVGGATRLLTLSIAFDEHPEDVHWVLLSTLRADRRVVAFGPERQYDRALAGKTLEVPIDASALSPASELKLILSDTAGDGICCRAGNGSFSVSDQEGRLLFNGTSEGKRREVYPFSLGT